MEDGGLWNGFCVSGSLPKRWKRIQPVDTECLSHCELTFLYPWNTARIPGLKFHIVLFSALEKQRNLSKIFHTKAISLNLATMEPYLSLLEFHARIEWRTEKIGTEWWNTEMKMSLMRKLRLGRKEMIKCLPWQVIRKLVTVHNRLHEYESNSAIFFFVIELSQRSIPNKLYSLVHQQQLWL